MSETESILSNTLPKDGKQSNVLQLYSFSHQPDDLKEILATVKTSSLYGAQHHFFTDSASHTSLIERAGAKQSQIPKTSKGIFGRFRLKSDFGSLAKDFDLVISNSAHLAPYGSMIAREKSIPHIRFIHDLPDIDGLEESLLPSDILVTRSHFMRETLAKAVRRPIEDIFHIYPGANLQNHEISLISPERTSSLAEAWGVDDKPVPILLIPEHFHSKDWQDLVLATTKTLYDQHGETFLFVVLGEDQTGAHRPNFERRLHELHLSNVIYTVGHCSDLSAAMKLASGLVDFSNKAYGFPYYAYRALLSSRPIIAYNAGALPEIIDNKNGALLDEYKLDDYVHTINQMLDIDESTLEHLSSASRVKIMQYFSADRMIHETLNLYDHALAHAPR